MVGFKEKVRGKNLTERVFVGDYVIFFPISVLGVHPLLSDRQCVSYSS